MSYVNKSINLNKFSYNRFREMICIMSEISPHLAIPQIWTQPHRGKDMDVSPDSIQGQEINLLILAGIFFCGPHQGL